MTSSTDKHEALRKTVLQQETAIHALLSSLGITHEDLQAFLEDKSRFTKEAWTRMEEEQARHTAYIAQQEQEIARLQKKLRSVSPSHIPNHWIPVR